MKEVKRLLVLFVVGLLLFSLTPVVAQDETTASTDNSPTTTETPTETEDTTIQTQTEIQNAEGDTSVQTEEVFEGLKEEYVGEKIKEGGMAPDSFLYGIDKFMDNFGDPLEVREERIAEIKDMVEDGNIDAAEEALEDYNERVEEMGEEPDPEKREEARRSAVAIYDALNEIKDRIPEDKKEEFYDNILEKENGILTSVEISSKIKELCVQLSELDPLEYSRVCQTEDNAPKWKVNLDKKLTEEQEKEARKFGDIIGECFKTSGRECSCEDISFSDFSVFCEKMSSLSVKCDEGDKDACVEMDESGQDMPELPPHLQDVFDDIQGRVSETKYEMYMPEECVKAGITNPKECGLLMTELYAPAECRDALKKAIEDGKVEGEREAREICDKIMFELHAPPECVKAGITNPKECGKIMFKSQAPPECIEGGITGENERDARECEALMRKMREGPQGRGPEGHGPPGARCMQIQNSNDRLICFEEAVGRGVGNYYGVAKERGPAPTGGQITWQCKENRIHDIYDCDRFMKEELPQMQRQREMEREIVREEKQRYYEENYEPPREDYRRPPEGQYQPPYQQPPEGEPYPTPPQEGQYQPPYQQPPEGQYQPPQEPTVPGPETPSPTPTPEPSPEPTPTPAPEPAPVTGQIFWDYYYR